MASTAKKKKKKEIKEKRPLFGDNFVRIARIVTGVVFGT